MASETPIESLPHLEIGCFGAPAVKVNGAEPPPDIVWRKNVALLVYLAMSPGLSRTREHLLGMLWPEKSEEKARHSLNEAVRRLRSGLGRERIISSGEKVILNSQALSVDAGELSTDQNQGAVRGDFLEGFYLDDAPEFDEWTSRQRDRFQRRNIEGMLEKGELLIASSYAQAREMAGEVLQRDPHSERGVSLYMRAAALSGDTSGALVAFNRFGTRLKDRIGETPSREINALADRIRRENWRRAHGRDVGTEPPLVGRTEEHQAAFATLSEGLTAGPICLAISSEPGMGRTRLVSTCLERLALEGAIVANVRPLESDGGAPWSTIRSLLRSGLGDAPGLAGTDPASLGVLASIDPSLADRFKPVEPRDHAHVASCLASLVEAIAEDSPIALAIDDAHFADGASLGALVSMMARLEAVPIILIVSIGLFRDNTPRELTNLEGEIGRSIPGTVISLPPLSESDMAELVTRWAGRNNLDGADPKRLARRIAYEAGGSPFLAVELLRGLEKASSLRQDAEVWPAPNQTLESPLPFQMPALVRRAIAARIVDLDEVSRKVLCTASVGGEVLDLDLLSQLSGLDEFAVDQAIASLERHRFIEFDGHRYLFAAPVIGDVVMQECLTRGEKQRLRLGAIKVLSGREDLDSKVLFAELLGAADPGESSFDHAVAVAEAALAGGSLRAAKRAMVAAQRSIDRGHGVGLDKLNQLREILDEEG